VCCDIANLPDKAAVTHLSSYASDSSNATAVDMPVPALTSKAMLPLRQVPQDLNPFHGRVSSDLVHANEDGRVLGSINRDHSAES
jgi:hypothetical protein